YPHHCKGKRPPASLVHAIWQSIINSPAYGILGINVIYLQSDIPEAYLPMILNHEELHLLVYREMKKAGLDSKRAGKASNFIDRSQLNKWLCEIFELDYGPLMRYLQGYIFRNLPLVRTAIKLGGRIRSWLK
ncbi:hypothetical protein GTO27_08320, partial [Candidatus Bathyarchaeota archaeon]|nr:hypothetical protein [Candidatus Bathyarchaeota archaeon]